MDNLLDFEFVEKEGEEQLSSGFYVKNAQLIDRRIEILINSTWRKGTIVRFTPEKDLHYILLDETFQPEAFRLR